MSATESEFVEVYALGYSGRDRVITTASYPPGASVGRIGCPECGGSGWWGFGPVEEVNGPCVVCKGTGRVWVGLA